VSRANPNDTSFGKPSRSDTIRGEVQETDGMMMSDIMQEQTELKRQKTNNSGRNKGPISIGGVPRTDHGNALGTFFLF